MENYINKNLIEFSKFKSLINVNICYIFIFCIFFSFNLNKAYSLEYFTGLTPSKSWIDYAGKIMIGENTTNPGDEIAVFVYGVNGEELLVGASEVGTTSKEYYMIHIFEDDSLTSIKDGAKNGDLLIFKFWQKSTNTVFPVLKSNMIHESINGLLSPSIPPVFQSGPMGTIYGQLNLAIPEIPLAVKNYDVNDDGKVNLGDVIFILKHLVR